MQKYERLYVGVYLYIQTSIYVYIYIYIYQTTIAFVLVFVSNTAIHVFVSNRAIHVFVYQTQLSPGGLRVGSVLGNYVLDRSWETMCWIGPGKLCVGSVLGNTAIHVFVYQTQLSMSYSFN